MSNKELGYHCEKLLTFQERQNSTFKICYSETDLSRLGLRIHRTQFKLYFCQRCKSIFVTSYSQSFLFLCENCLKQDDKNIRIYKYL